MGARAHTSPILVRPYRRGDASSVRRLLRVLQAHVHRLEPATERGAWIAPRYFRVMMRAARSGGVAVAERGGNVVGFVAYFIDDTREAVDTVPIRYLYVSDLAVDPKARRLGVARALLEDASAFARRRRLHDVRLDVLATNRLARAAYRACGFREHLLTLVRP